MVLRNVYEYRDLRVISKSLKPIDTMLSVGLTTRSVLEEDDRTIRSWGCNITATPFIFVHIGKNHIWSLLSKRRAVGCLSLFIYIERLTTNHCTFCFVSHISQAKREEAMSEGDWRLPPSTLRDPRSTGRVANTMITRILFTIEWMDRSTEPSFAAVEGTDICQLPLDPLKDTASGVPQLHPWVIYWLVPRFSTQAVPTIQATPSRLI